VKSEVTLEQLGPSHTITYKITDDDWSRIEGCYAPLMDGRDADYREYRTAREAVGAIVARRIDKARRAFDRAEAEVQRCSALRFVLPPIHRRHRAAKAQMAKMGAEIDRLCSALADLPLMLPGDDLEILKDPIERHELGVEIVPAPESFQFAGGFLPIGTLIYGVRFDHYGPPRMLEGEITGYETRTNPFQDEPFMTFYARIDMAREDGWIKDHAIDSTWIAALQSEEGDDLRIHGHLFFLDEEHARALAMTKVSDLMGDLRILRHQLGG